MLHLVHPALVHFSVAFLVAGGLAEMWGLLSRREVLARWGGGAVLLGTLSLVPTIVSGYVAGNTVTLSDPAQALLAAHERNGLWLAGALLAGHAWKAFCGGRLPPEQRRPYALLLAVIVALTAYGAWLGGRLVYVEAVGVNMPSFID